MNQDILEGLRVALLRGESLNQAMKTFQNAGYDIKEVQEAARELQPNITNQIPLSNPINSQNKNSLLIPINSKNKISLSESIKPNEILKSKIVPLEKHITKPSIQKVSNYEQSQQNPRKIIVTLIIILLTILILGLIVIFLFRESILNFIESLFE